jgi:hypothetical protein
LRRFAGTVGVRYQSDHCRAEFPNHPPSDVGEQFGVHIAVNVDVLGNGERDVGRELLREPDAALCSGEGDHEIAV